MVFKTEGIIERLKELDVIMEELSLYKEITVEDLRASLSKRWIIERGLIVASNIIFDIADHTLASRFHTYPETYEHSLQLLYEKNIITKDLFEKIEGLGGFRNILVHESLGIDINEEYQNFQKALKVFKEFGKEILHFLEGCDIKGINNH